MNRPDEILFEAVFHQDIFEPGQIVATDHLKIAVMYPTGLPADAVFVTRTVTEVREVWGQTASVSFSVSVYDQGCTERFWEDITFGWCLREDLGRGMMALVVAEKSAGLIPVDVLGNYVQSFAGPLDAMVELRKIDPWIHLFNKGHAKYCRLCEHQQFIHEDHCPYQILGEALDA